MRYLPFILGAVALLLGLGHAQSPTASTGVSGFSFPYRKGGKTVALFTGSEHKPLSVTVVKVKDFRLETYSGEGVPNLQGAAPECILDLSTRQITSEGPVSITQAGGAFTLSGVGFQWDQEAERLVLSNRVHATFRLTTRSSSLLSRP